MPLYQEPRRWYERQDILCWVFGIIFITGFSTAIMVLGAGRGWYAPSGFVHNVSVTSQQRFWPEPIEEEPGVHGRFGKGRVSRWYYWKLPPNKVTLVTRVCVWICYSAHQLFIWTVTYFAQIKKTCTSESKYSSAINKYNCLALGGNVFFHLIHLLQTHTTYDALAQDVHVTSSQGSVIMLLVYVILMEYKERGIAFGWPLPKHRSPLALSHGPLNIVRKYHGYAFSWAVIYTFWYHPLENTYGHLTGIIHTWIIMLQGSLMFTNFHLNKWWRLLVETWVTIHGSLVAYQTGGDALIWPMFLCGFLFLACFTQVFSLEFLQRKRWYWCILPMIFYAMVSIGIYSYFPDGKGRRLGRLYEIMFIPSAIYLISVTCHGFLLLGLKMESQVSKFRKKSFDQKLPWYCDLPLVIAFLILIIFTIAGWFVEFYDFQGEVFVLMNILSLFYSIGFVPFAIILKQSIPMDIVKSRNKNI